VHSYILPNHCHRVITQLQFIIIIIIIIIVTESLRRKYGPGVDPNSNRNEYHGYMLGVKADGA